MFPKDISRSLCLRDTQSHTRRSEPCLGLFERALYTLFHALGHRLLQLRSRSLIITQFADALLPFVQLGITQHGVLNHLAALILVSGLLLPPIRSLPHARTAGAPD